MECFRLLFDNLLWIHHRFLRFKEGTESVRGDERCGRSMEVNTPELDQLLWPRDQETEFPVEAYWLSQTKEGQTEQIHPQTFDDPFLW